jgi:dihydroorotate dehydrogenase (NAD+) catalytic subunit
MTTLDVNVGGVLMKNPVATASGTCGYGELFTQSYKPSELGAIVVKGISLEPRSGNLSPRMTETPCGMLNAIGLENVGLDVFLSEKLPWLRDNDATVVVNIFGEKTDDYAKLAGKLSEVEGVHGLELNISCPNVKEGGIAFGVNPDSAREVVQAVRRETKLPVWVKLSPNVTDIVEMAQAVEASGADAISLINTLLGMAIDINTRKPVLANITGGLSGPAIKPVAIRMVYQTAKAVNIPIIGIGGITSPQDAIEFIIAGATAVQIGTANFTDPGTPIKVIEGIKKYLEENNVGSVSELTKSIDY